MENLNAKTTKKRVVSNKKSGKSKKMISEEDIRQRAFEIYMGNGNFPHNELDDWFRAERELRESEK
jgi:hypothetical protein